jgi:hypothetical protein
VAEASFGGYINRANYDRPELSFMGFTLGATVHDPELDENEQPISIWAAGIDTPKEVRSWRDFDGLTLEYEGDTSWTFTCFDGLEHHCVVSNRWTFRRVAGNVFHVTWEGDIEYEYENVTKHILVSIHLPFDGIRVSDVATVEEASDLFQQYFDPGDFEAPFSRDDNFVFLPKTDGN